jgi:hypothetical protein
LHSLHRRETEEINFLLTSKKFCTTTNQSAMECFSCAHFLSIKANYGTPLSTLRGEDCRQRLSGYERRRRHSLAGYDCLLPLRYGSEKACASYRRSESGKQKGFSSNPGDSPFTTRRVIPLPELPRRFTKSAVS